MANPTVKIEVDTTQLDEATAKIEGLIAQLKVMEGLLQSINELHSKLGVE